MLLGRLGAGGMGVVYLGRSPGGRLVAVKEIRPELASDLEFRIRFAREVAAARKVSGLFTAGVVDADPDAGRPWLVTNFVAGPSLADAVAVHGPLPAASVLALAAGLAEGLSAVHAAGVVHRDLKPSNVLLAPDGPRLIDFGISQAIGGTVLTSVGMVVGSPGFMSPEQAQGEPVGPASDMFSLGSVLAFAATGEQPFGPGAPSVQLYRVVHATARLAGVPGPLRPLVERCLDKDPARRPTAAQFLSELAAADPSAADLSDWLPPPVAASAPPLRGLRTVERAPGQAGSPGPWTEPAASGLPSAASGLPSAAGGPPTPSANGRPSVPPGAPAAGPEAGTAQAGWEPTMTADPRDLPDQAGDPVPVATPGAVADPGPRGRRRWVVPGTAAVLVLFAVIGVLVAAPWSSPAPAPPPPIADARAQRDLERQLQGHVADRHGLDRLQDLVGFLDPRPGLLVRRVRRDGARQVRGICVSGFPRARGGGVHRPGTV